MDKYVFYVKEKKTQVLLKSQLSAEDIKKLKQQGFKKHHLEVEAENQRSAIEKLNALTDENLKALSDYSGNILFSAVIFVIILAISLYNL
jgi:trans-2-enoyl-CoA reductase